MGKKKIIEVHILWPYDEDQKQTVKIGKGATGRKLLKGLGLPEIMFLFRVKTRELIPEDEDLFNILDDEEILQVSFPSEVV